MNWKAAYLESRILSADPVELVCILYEHAILAVEDARDSLATGDIPSRSKAISKAIAIIGELDSSLNHEAGGEVSKNLARLYQYVRERLVAANMKQEAAPLAEVAGLLKTVAEAWAAIRPEEAAQATPPSASAIPNGAWAFTSAKSLDTGAARHWSA